MGAHQLLSIWHQIVAMSAASVDKDLTNPSTASRCSRSPCHPCLSCGSLTHSHAQSSTPGLKPAPQTNGSSAAPSLSWPLGAMRVRPPQLHVQARSWSNRSWDRAPARTPLQVSQSPPGIRPRLGTQASARPLVSVVGVASSPHDPQALCTGEPRLVPASTESSRTKAPMLAHASTYLH